MQKKLGAQQNRDRMAKLTKRQRFARKSKPNTPIPPDRTGILSKDHGRKAHIIDKAGQWVVEENHTIASSNPAVNGTSYTEAVKARLRHQYVEECWHTSTDQQVSVPDTVRERPGVRMPLADQPNPKHEIIKEQIPCQMYLDSRAQLVTGYGPGPTTYLPKSIREIPEHRLKTWAEV